LDAADSKIKIGILLRKHLAVCWKILGI